MRARDIVRYARKNKLIIDQDGDNRSTHCAASVVAHMVLGPKTAINRWTLIEVRCACYNKELAKYKMTPKRLLALEAGFEGWSRSNDEPKRYYDMGVRVRELAKV
jgi:hypothetical protein